jgi:glucose/mannose-6-phosphate isomerase
MLDDMETIKKIDKSSMIDTITQFSEQILETISMMSEFDVPAIDKIDNIVICGMGGSAISGDILQNLFRNSIQIPIFVNRDYNLPKWVNEKTIVIVQSYSGNTEETLSSFKDAIRRQCIIFGVSSGGILEKECISHNIPFVKIPKGYAPRAATAYLLFSNLILLEKLKIVDGSIKQDIEETIYILKDAENLMAKTSPERQNLAKQLAQTLFQSIPQVYGWNIYEPIARRWCTQLNENSKVIARYDFVSECNHNDIVGWSMDPIVSKNFICFLFRDTELESPNIKKRLDFMKSLYKNVAGNVIEIYPKGKSNLSKMMYTMCLGDFVSCYLAILRKIDPTPVDIITKLKEELSQIA